MNTAASLRHFGRGPVVANIVYGLNASLDGYVDHQVLRSMHEVGPNATIEAGDLGDLLRKLEAESEGEIEIAGTLVAQRATSSAWWTGTGVYLHPGDARPGQAVLRPPHPTPLPDSPTS